MSLRSSLTRKIALILVCCSPFVFAAAPRFLTAPSYPAGPLPSSVGFGDFNGDGILDLAVTNLQEAGTVSVLMGRAGGSFHLPVSYSTGALNPVAIAVADVTGDPKLDMVVLNSCNNGQCPNGSMAVLPGNGDGTFQAAVNRDVGTTPRSLATI
jgi:hypothetical protein